jgi:hypothetical protein
VREHAGLLLQDLSGSLRGGYHQDVGEADGEVEEASVNLGELGQAAVGELVHGQQVADDGQPRRPRRKSTTTSPPQTPTKYRRKNDITATKAAAAMPVRRR